MILTALAVVIGFVGMELASIFIHKYLMHGPLWFLHKTHHVRSKGFFEWNDLFSLFFGSVAGFLIYRGLAIDIFFIFGIGSGITLYGLLYFVLHDVLIHQRIEYKWKPLNTYLKAVKHAHRQHHKHISKTPGESYGLFLFSKKYLDNVKDQ